MALSSEHESETWFEMKYVHGQKYSEFLERASIAGIRAIAQKFNAYFIQQFENAGIQIVNKNLFIDKAEAVKDLLKNRPDLNNALIAKAFSFLTQIPGEKIPVSSCHGDFTLSNMLFDKEDIYLVDFLDSFIESPLIDLVKFRQDTFFNWSLSIEKNIPEARSSKIVQILRYLDQEVVNVFKSNMYFIYWYDYLQVFNLIRILPYVQQTDEIQLVQRGISQILMK